jgi:uncharacterized membrane protein HdeD (DUF308 family)
MTAFEIASPTPPCYGNARNRANVRTGGDMRTWAPRALAATPPESEAIAARRPTAQGGTMVTAAAGPSAPEAGTPSHSRGWSIFWGVLLIVTGILAILMPGVAALATALTLAWLLVFAGSVEIVHAVQTRRRAGYGWKLASGIVTLLLGLSLLLFPIAGIATLALWIGVFVLVGGIVRLVLAFRLRPHRGWGWVLFDALLSIVIGGLIAWGWPASSIAFIGLLAGFWLLFAGVWRIVVDGRAAA